MNLPEVIRSSRAHRPRDWTELAEAAAIVLLVLLACFVVSI
jgi:hypothetical protein